LWVPDHTILHEIGQMCRAEAERIVSRADASPAALRRAETLRGVRTAENIKRSLAGHPRMIALPREFDEHDLIFGVPGGYVDAEGKLRDPDPSLLLTKCMLVRPDGSRKPKRWIEQLMRLANLDKDTFEALRMALGYTLTGTTREQAFFFLYGAAGGEGKTQFLELISLIMGDYAMHAEIETFMDVKGYRRSFDLNDLEGYWFVYGSEAGAGMRWHETRLKTGTGGERMHAEGKFQHGRDFRPRFALWFAGNHRPRFHDADGAIRRRLYIFECEIPVPKDMDIRRYSEVVLREEGPYILAWLLEARADYLKQGLYLPPRMAASRDAYFDMQDKILGFANERCSFGAELMEPREAVYLAYRAWCLEAGLQPESKPEFYRRLEQHVGLRKLGVEMARKRLEPGRDNLQQRVVLGLSLKRFDDEVT
jgi:putative DNA primase/helicase